MNPLFKMGVPILWKVILTSALGHIGDEEALKWFLSQKKSEQVDELDRE